ncbi:ABC transporter ATP-binding protein [Helicobacter sp. MIT 99-5507]|uniref:ABC transporter ATP-binding protein n=1 Tax=Helicobacter sp. MIT 99-5507 TaxID=152489 RepID=UPI000E1F544D|nr:ATP-binding cassette domain-containing protein [Helicobacter sp. MIT 99-5507]RDU58074.1 ABC transporter ATP-binding protein [Helicobacter sp. MIT 99-5507]
MKNIIEVTNLTTSYKNRIIQDNISFNVKYREIFGILGGSGSGKSTLLSTMIYLKKPVSGSIKIFDLDIWKINQNKRSVLLRKCGVVFQFGALYSSLNVLDNVGIMLEEYSFYPKKIINEISQYFINIVGLPNYVKDMYPHELSGGMKKRVGLARALAFNPKILFLDEPTSGLDPKSAENFDKLILKLRDHFNLSVVMVTHDLDSIKDITDRFILLDNSKILFSGSLQDFRHSQANNIDNLLKSKRGERLWREG